MNFLDELKWRGLIQDMTPGLEEHLAQGPARGYIGFDPTAPSLTIGNYVQIMLLSFLQRGGHRPVVLMGGATGRIGDPSGRDTERELKSAEELEANIARQEAQFRRLLDFDLLLNNYDFYKNMNVLDFLRDAGKYLTVNYMLAKESVQRRIETGISFTEFSYQLIQGYDFVLLHRKHGITLQMGGSDQYGNITAGIELARKIDGARLYGATTPLLTKADGTKFGKSASGNIWLDPAMTSPYRFYQFWINADDRDLPKFFRYFSFKSREEIEALESAESAQSLKRIFAEELTRRIHGDAEYAKVQQVSELLFNPKAGPETLRAMDADTLEQVAGEIPSPVLPLASLQQSGGIELVNLLQEAELVASKSEARRAIENKSVTLNKIKVEQTDARVSDADLLHGRYLMLEVGKKNKILAQAQG